MRVRYLGHAGLLIESCGRTILCDPWLSRSGAFGGAWYPFPSNQHLDPLLKSTKIDYIFVSHEHSDHYDPNYLATLSHEPTLLVPQYPSRAWRKLVLDLGFADTWFLRDAEERDLAPGLRAAIFQAPSPFNHDSALVVYEEATGEVLVNLNDCSIDHAQATTILNRYGAVTLALGQFSGAIWFPFVYEFPLEQRIASARAMVKTNLDRWRTYMGWLNPKQAVPFAGPAALLDQQLRPYFRAVDSIFPTPVELRRYLEETEPSLGARMLVPLPGDVIDLATQRLEADADVHARFDWQDCDRYLEQYAQEMQPDIEQTVGRHPWPEQSVFPDFARSFDDLLAAAPTLAQRVNARVCFHATGPGGGRWLVDFANLSVADISSSTEPREQVCDYEFTFESRYVKALTSYELRWEDFLLSFRFTAWRPGVESYNMFLTSFLRFGRPDELATQEKILLKAREGYDSSTFELNTDDGRLLVQEFCPHMGQKLSAGCFETAKSVITCPRHGWQFDVPSGRCLNARSGLRMLPAAVESVG